ncbi:branched-chain amino acid ABC transporter substrate-binding protein [Bacillus sp. RG28]|uniref:Branched-chain amino acid ABC transporter substrate-binding protein n=1 Tax=Gottfriedia endophytica TaxID=2820819 RepID=A0A940NNJ7_9BACI|nr:branched-chain amino acid ABC transporter substrate-binding protein [Gottfriedia endophytica]MBP0725901.1 branched-chain amino acid ABC transporter substrate-binding protein [Gottfriedia endophytica]
MMLKKGVAILATASLTAGLLAGCGNGKDSKDKNKVIEVATQSPLSGGSATLGDSIKLGAQMELENQKADFKKLGFDLKLVPYDDQGDPTKGVSNAEQIAADTSILGVVGHLNSGVAIPSSLKYEKAHIPMVSPANTATEVTDRGLSSVNRICARDDFQGPAGANYAVNTLKAKNIYIIQDKTAYGTGLADAFKDAAAKLGAKIVGYEGITVGEKDFNGVINNIATKKPDLVFFGGLYAEGGLIIKQAADKGLKMPFMGGDGLDSSTLVEIAGDAVKNVYYTSVAADTLKVAGGQEFANQYKKEFNKNIESYSAYGYDSMGVILQGIKNAIKDNNNKMPSREEVEKAVRDIQDFNGVVTKVGFDEKGDNKFAKVYIYHFDETKYPGKQIDEISK